MQINPVQPIRFISREGGGGGGRTLVSAKSAGGKGEGEFVGSIGRGEAPARVENRIGSKRCK